MTDIMAGLIILLFNLHPLMRNMARQWLTPDSAGMHSVIWTSFLPGKLLQLLDNSQTDLLYRLMISCFLGIWVYLASLVLLAIARRRPKLAALGVGGLLLGGLSLAILGWSMQVVWWIVLFFVGILRFIAFIVMWLFNFLFHILLFLWPVLAVCLAIVVIYYLWKSFGGKAAIMAVLIGVGLYLCAPLFKALYHHIIRPLFQWISALLASLLPFLWPALAVCIAIGVIYYLWRRFSGAAVVFAALIGGVLYLLGPLFRAIYQHLILPVFQWIGAVLAPLIVILKMALFWLVKMAGLLVIGSVILAIIGCFGRLLIDQIRGSWYCGRSANRILVGSFSLGVALAFILLTASGPAENRAVLSRAPRTETMVAVSAKRAVKAAKSRKTRAQKIPEQPFLSQGPPPPPPTVSLAEIVDSAWMRVGFVGIHPAKVFSAMLPAPLRLWAATNFNQPSAPNFDALVLLISLILATASMFVGIVSAKNIEPGIKFYNRDLAIVGGIPLYIILWMIANSDVNQDG